MQEVIRVTPVNMVTYDGASINVYHANKNEGLPKHSHAYSHLTICTSGSCIIRKENKELKIDKHNTPVNLLANDWHEIEALENDTVFINIFSEGKY
jgi:quercetin dioxygenase-like cupin family protein